MSSGDNIKNMIKDESLEREVQDNNLKISLNNEIKERNQKDSKLFNELVERN